MCGICGLYNFDGKAAPAEPVVAARETLAHRGPDDAGLWSDGPIALGFRRLSILDLAGGHQPMLSADGRKVVVFNGEIYNHPELRAELESSGAKYRTRSDTETLLHLYERSKDVHEMFRRINGMFAVALWDLGRQELILARDPVGIKPLYYSIQGNRLLFASELRALLTAGVSDELSSAAVSEYLLYGCVRAPRTVLANVMKLRPGHILRASPRGIQVEKYWDFAKPAHSNDGREVAEAEALRRVETLLTQSVRRQLLSDVPLGAFLSGGLDSSLIAALMCREAGRKVSTFTIGFSGAKAGTDESAHARAVSRHLGTDHHELVLPANVLDRMEELGPCLDEPIADSAILPTFLLARFARQSVKVVLTGEGADELFAGYGRYKAAYISERMMDWPGAVRRLLTPLSRRMGRGTVFESIPLRTVGEWARAGIHSPVEALRTICRSDYLNSIDGTDPLAWIWPEEADAPNNLNESLAFDMRTILVDSLLMKVDKATMRASLEARVPFLDVELMQYAMDLPATLKMRRLKGKYLLRRLASKYLPDEIVWRRKHGFIVPWEEWVRRPGDRHIDDLLSGSELSRRKLFDIDNLRGVRNGLLSGNRDLDAGLFFRVVVLGLWIETLAAYKNKSSAAA